jgi:hypothetical protein
VINSKNLTGRTHKAYGKFGNAYKFPVEKTEGKIICFDLGKYGKRTLKLILKLWNVLT